MDTQTEAILPGRAAEAPTETAVPVRAYIDSAWYDGSTLAVALAAEQTTLAEIYSPTEEELSAMYIAEDLDENGKPKGTPNVFAFSDSGDRASQVVIDGYYAAVEAGEPYGLLFHDLYFSDHMTANGSDLGAPVGVTKKDESGYFETREYYDLPEALQDQDNLSLSVTVRSNALYVYFDGTKTYYRSESDWEDTVSAVVTRTDRGALTPIG